MFRSRCALFLAFIALPAFASPRLPATVTWIGNSYPGGDGRHVPQDIDALCVTPDGRVFSNVFWEEGGGNVTEFKDGQVIGSAGHTHGWGNTGGRAIACNSKYLFIGCRMENEGGGLNDLSTWPPKGKTWLGISRRPLDDIRKAAPFDGGKGGKGDTLKGAFLVVAEVADTKDVQDLPGLAADDKRLYVSCPADNTIKIYDAETMARVDEWKIERPGPIALAKDGTLLMIQRQEIENKSTVLAIDQKGRVSPLTPKIEPGSFVAEGTTFLRDFGRINKWVSISLYKDRLFLLDQGMKQNIDVFRWPSTAWADQIGEYRGIFSGAGKIWELNFNNPSAIAIDAQGNLYIAHRGSTGGGSTVLESYDVQHKLRWRLFGLEFVDMADADPFDDTQIFTKEERFSYDYSKIGTDAWRYEAYTVHPWRIPQDPRLHIWSAGAWARAIYQEPPEKWMKDLEQIRSKNRRDLTGEDLAKILAMSNLALSRQRILFVNDMNAEYLQVYRFVGGDFAVPCVLFSKRHIKQDDNWPPNQPEKGEWIWTDKNGNGAFDADEYDSRDTDAPSAQGWWVDNNGGVWLATEKQGLRYFPCEVKNGVPGWSYATMQTFPHAKEFDEIKRVRYDVKTDTLYLGGTKGEDKNQHWKPMGPVIARYDGWLKGERKLRWQITAPYQKGASGHESCEPMGFDVAGDYVFVPYTGAGKQLGYKTGHIEVFRAADGAPVGNMEPGADIGEIGLQDIRECLRAHQRADGEYIVFLEEDYKAKILIYRWKP